MVHEDFQEHVEAKGPSDRNTGLVFAAFFALVAIAPLRKGLPVRIWAIAVAALLALVALAAPKILLPLNTVWTKLALLLQRIVQPVVLGILFYVVFVPFAFLLKAVGKTPLRIGWDRRIDSYWVERNPPGPDPDSMINQF